MTIRGPTKHELDTLIKDGARGWENQLGEFDFWFSDDDADASAGVIEGEVPQQLLGTFLRNGPGVTVVYGTPLKHPIDGDGMVCALTFINGKVHFRNRFVQTASHRKEAEAKRMIFPGQMGSRPPPGGSKKWRDPSHTNVFYWGGKILACHEYSLPHCLDPATLQTVGRETLGGVLDIKTLSAHFRYDADEDLLATIAFKPGVDILRMAPQVRLYEFDRKWNLMRKTAVSLKGLNYAHDFAMTPDWYVLHMSPFVNIGKESTNLIMSGKKTPGELLRHYPECPSKMVLVERSRAFNKGDTSGAAPRILQFDTEPCHIYHFGTCVQSADGQRIEFNAACAPPGFTMDWQHKSFLSNSADAPVLMKQYTVTLGDAPKLQRKDIEALATTGGEFPFTNPFRHCVRDLARLGPQRYFYLMAAQEGIAMPFCDVVKHDVLTGKAERWHSPGVVGEPCFVPRLGEASGKHGDEDDGWIIAQVYIPGVHRTEFVILDAKHVAAGPICRLKLKEHIPIAFHGTFTHNVFVHPTARL